MPFTLYFYHAVGLHPIISVFSLLVGMALFGLLGALFACPAAGIIQTFVRAFWDTWHERHPEQFPAEEEQEPPPVEVAGHDHPAVSTEAPHRVLQLVEGLVRKFRTSEPTE